MVEVVLSLEETIGTYAGAQRIVDNTKLLVYSASVLDPKPDTVTFTVDTSLDIPLAVKIRTDPLNLSLFNRDEKPMEPYFIAALSTFSLKGGTNMINLTQRDNKILSQHQFVKILATAVYQDRFVISVKGSTVGHIGALKASLALDKDVELTGLDKFSGISVPSAYLIPKQDDGTNFKATAVLPNRSVFTIAMVRLTTCIR
ncbi:hypothetical protein PENSUB_3514 [Penicillium subrubescens]|uniref:Uncharacterized protein n=1 Tax=Penicillium subrubescens TaxID=1316194 RepID=A0A1Q5UF18_9EURO|nr:hypothetical protein PENSUB_3514 [Penicillium subrubescens]